MWKSKVCCGEGKQLGPGAAADVHLLERSPTGGMLTSLGLMVTYGPETPLFCPGSHVLRLSHIEMEL